MKTIILRKLQETKVEWDTEQYFRVATAHQVLNGVNEIWQLALDENNIEHPSHDVAVVASVQRPQAPGEWDVRLYWRDAVWTPISIEHQKVLDDLSKLAKMIRSNKPIIA